MTHDELQVIKARAEAATPGPWEVEQKDCWVLRAPNAASQHQSLMGDEQYYPWTPERDEDWQFIAHARTDVPALIGEVERLHGILDGILGPLKDATVETYGGPDFIKGLGLK